MKLIDLILVVVKKLLEIQENKKTKVCLSQKIWKMRNYLSLKNWLSQKKNCQKVGIHLILV